MADPVRRILALNTTSQIIGKVVSASAALFISVIIARAYGATGYGDFTKVTTFVALFYLLSDFGLNAIYLQKESQGKTTWQMLLGTRLVISLILTFCAVSVLAFLPMSTIAGYTPLVRLAIILFAPTIVAQGVITTANAYFQKRFRYDLSAASVSVGSLVSFGLIWFFAQTTTQATGLLLTIFALGMGSLVTSLVSLFFVKKLEMSLIPLFTPAVFFGLVRSSLPLGLTLIFNLVHFRIDSFVLTLTRSTAEVGIYGFAYKLFETSLVAPTFFMNALYPLLLIASPSRFRQMVKKSFLVLIGLSLGTTVFFWTLAPQITHVRPEFILSISVLRILSLGLPFFFVSSLFMWALIARKKLGILVLIYGISMLITGFADVYFIPTYGYIAASWITVISEGLVLAMSGAVLSREIGPGSKA